MKLEQADSEHLRKENAKLRMERTLLETTATYFAREM